MFANTRSPDAVANLRQNPSVDVNVVDPFARKGYRFKGTATILEAGPASIEDADQSSAFAPGLHNSARQR